MVSMQYKLMKTESRIEKFSIMLQPCATDSNFSSHFMKVFMSNAKKMYDNDHRKNLLNGNKHNFE